ncbi:MAG: alkene reductase, partial [Lysobacteraceae bacterium]
MNASDSLPNPLPPADVWTPAQLARVTVKNRLVMAPMTRSRALPSGVPGPHAATYYTQRAGLGLLISEGTQPSDEGQGYIFTPGIYTDAHVQGWKQVTDAVHTAGSRIYIQLMHVGRLSHPDNAPGHAQAVAPSAIAPQTQMFTRSGMQPIP